MKNENTQCKVLDLTVFDKSLLTYSTENYVLVSLGRYDSDICRPSKDIFEVCEVVDWDNKHIQVQVVGMGEQWIEYKFCKLIL